MIQYSFQQIATITNGEMFGNSNATFSTQDVFIDSRSTLQGNSIFFALKGKRFQAEQFIPELIEKGVQHFVIEQGFPVQQHQANFIVVYNVQQALQQFAKYHRSQFQFPVIGITGSNGKTIVKEWLFQLLTKEFSLVKSPKSYNSQVGVPLSIFQMEQYHNLALFEAGISTVGEMQHLANMLQPTIGIFTTIGSAHDEGFSSSTEKLNEKLNLFEQAETIVFCENQQNVAKAIQNRFPNRELVSWTINDNVFSYKQVQIPLPENKSKVEQENIGHCMALLVHLGYSTAEINAKISRLQAIPHRLQIVKGKEASKLINDSYNNDFGGLKVALELAKQQAEEQLFHLILSQFEQTGLQEKEIAQKLSQILSNYPIDQFYGIGPFFTSTAVKNVSFGKKSNYFLTTEDFLQSTAAKEFAQSVVLIKGARNFELETIIDQFREKSHDTVWEINLSAFSNNVNVFRSLLKPTTKLLVMVKAFAYGTSARQIAKLLQYQKIDYLGVAYAEEGRALRENGISSPILVLNTSEETFADAVENKLEIETYSIKHLQQLIQFLESKEIKHYPVHIKLDTGMHRLGFLEHELEQVVDLLQSTNCIIVKGIFSHLSSADDEKEKAFTLQQQETFIRMSNQLKVHCKKPPILHLLNTAGIVNSSLKKFDMVRLGIGAYGFCSNENIQQQLIQVGSLKASISQLKLIKKGDSVGYNRAFIAPKAMTIGVVTIGYADGYDRRFGNGVGKVLVRGKLVETVGNICMDMCMINLSEVPQAKEGDEVIITSPEHSAKELAQQIGTIPYELLTDVSIRIPRRFIVE